MKISELTTEDIGRWVWYKPNHAKDDESQWEKGRIKSWNGTNIFVVYEANGMLHGREEWKDFTAQSTRPEDLEFV